MTKDADILHFLMSYFDQNNKCTQNSLFGTFIAERKKIVCTVQFHSVWHAKFIILVYLY
jgi:hypothetical protein